MSEFTFVVEGRGLGSALAEMKRSDTVKVLGPHISTYYPGSGADGERMVVVATARDADAAEELLWDYLGPSRNYAVSVDLRARQGAV
jgi:hypothetical protein